MADERVSSARAREAKCPRCAVALRSAARFCPACGFALPAQASASAAPPGMIPHPAALQAPPGAVAVSGSANLSFTWESALGGKPLIGTEGFRVTMFNAGHDLFNVEIELVARGAGGRALRIAREIAEAPRGKSVEVEVASWEVPRPLDKLEVALKSARLTPFA